MKNRSYKLRLAGKKTAFDIHVHTEGVNTENEVESTDYISGKPNTINTIDDYEYRGFKESQGKVSEPSWAIGTQNRRNADSGKGTDFPTSKKILMFYNSQKVIKRVSCGLRLQKHEKVE